MKKSLHSTELIGFHLIIGFSIYFHDSLEDIIGIRNTDDV